VSTHAAEDMNQETNVKWADKSSYTTKIIARQQWS